MQPAENGRLARPRAILVTGGTGFIGSNIVAHLAQHGHRVVAFDLAPPPAIVERYWAAARERISFEAGSVTDLPRLQAVAEQHAPEAIVHAAAVTAVDPATEARLAVDTVAVNVMGTVNVLEVARRPAIRRMIYIGASGVYVPADPLQPVLESAPTVTGGVEMYTLSKVIGERLCRRYARLFDLDVAIGRIGGPYGPMERETGVRPVLYEVYRLAPAALTLGTVRLRAVEHVYDWTYTRDQAEAVRRLLAAHSLPHTEYNLSGGTLWRLSEVIAALEALIPGARFVAAGPGEAADLDLGEPYRRGPLSIERLRRDTGFAPAYDLERGLRAALPWWAQMVHAS